MPKSRLVKLFARWTHTYLLSGMHAHLLPGYLMQVPDTTSGYLMTVQPRMAALSASHRWSLVHHASFLPTRYIFPWSTPSSSPHSDFYNLPYPMSISDSTSIMNALQGFFRSLLSNHGNMEMVINTGEEGCLLTSCLKKSTSQLCLSENPCFTV